VKLFSALAGEYPTKGALLRHPAVAGISHLGEERKRACFTFRRRRSWPITDTYAGTFLFLWCSAPAERSDANPVLRMVSLPNPTLQSLLAGQRTQASDGKFVVLKLRQIIFETRGFSDAVYSLILA
jgi:hypothetical protein